MNIHTITARSFAVLAGYFLFAIAAAALSVARPGPGPLDPQAVRDYLGLMSFVSCGFSLVCLLPRFRALSVACLIGATLLTTAPAVFGHESIAEDITLTWLRIAGIS